MACTISREDRSGLWIDSEASGEPIQDLARDKEYVREHPRAQPRPGRPGLAEYFTPNAYEGRALRNEAICRAYIKGRFIQREIGECLGLHPLTESCIIRAKDKEQATGGPAMSQHTNSKDLTPFLGTNRRRGHGWSRRTCGKWGGSPSPT